MICPSIYSSLPTRSPTFSTYSFCPVCSICENVLRVCSVRSGLDIFIFGNNYSILALEYIGYLFEEGVYIPQTAPHPISIFLIIIINIMHSNYTYHQKELWIIGKNGGKRGRRGKIIYCIVPLCEGQKNKRANWSFYGISLLMSIICFILYY